MLKKDNLKKVIKLASPKIPRKKTKKTEKSQDGDLLIEKEIVNEEKSELCSRDSFEDLVCEEKQNPVSNNNSKSKAINFFDKLTKYCVYTLILLLPIFFIPTPFLDLNQVKIGLAVFLVSIAVISMGISILYRGHFQHYGKKVLISIGLIGIFALLSAIFSTSYKGAYLGLGIETDSLYFIFLMLAIVLLVSSVIKTKGSTFTVMSLLWAGFGLTAIFQLLRILFSGFGMQSVSGLLSLGGLFDLLSLNTVGTLSDFGIFSGIIALTIAVTLDMLSLKKNTKIILWIIFAMSTILVAIASSILFSLGVLFFFKSSMVGVLIGLLSFN